MSEDTYLEPDLVLFDRTQGLEVLAGESAYLVVEIADSSLGYDLGRKAALYASFGVKELWVIDAVKLVTHVLRMPDVEGYRDIQIVATDAHVTPLIAPKAFALRLADLGVA
ncbi:hypothetical protein RHAL1_02030 [Beijerinckiaceae bacterium RH AL1]|nr:hypothetical protein RHCH11_RHCH11_01990 [Beijerinckiaceae bacterium RH CH11]VVB46015.1 hypothetical protein RHAL8_01986 [Beijerinckiaceae bacterium RH AL8]VVC55117.1 hypothetical protein RHAL1_02030 [Beijerinckiaceae bacterium RH AL1]